jgi:Ca2+-binding RTX toxin-like protein
MPTQNMTIFEDQSANVDMASSASQTSNHYLYSGGDYGSDFVFTLLDGRAQTVLPASGAFTTSGGEGLRLDALQDHHAESAETITIQVSREGETLHNDVTVIVTILDRSTRDEYISQALQDGGGFSYDQTIQNAWLGFADKYLGPINNPNNYNLEAERAEEYLVGLTTATHFASNVLPDYSALQWLALNFQADWLQPSFVLNPLQPTGALDALEGVLDGYVTVNGGTSTIEMTLRSLDAPLDRTGVFGGSNYHLVVSSGPVLQPGSVVFDKLGGDYVLSNKADVLFEAASGNVSLGYGDDVGIAYASNVTLSGDDGDDYLVAASGGSSLNGGEGDDVLIGGAGPNQLFAGGGQDRVYGGAGADLVNGNQGDDTIDGGSGGADSLYGGQGNDLIVAHSGAANINGNIGSDTIVGGSGAETLHGGQGDDNINGGVGDDWIYGDLGDDTLTGGAGSDTFRVSPGAVVVDGVTVNSGVDTIVDFNPAQHDHLMIDAGAAYTVSQLGPNVVITFDVGGQVVLNDTVLANLPSDWLLFG